MKTGKTLKTALLVVLVLALLLSSTGFMFAAQNGPVDPSELAADDFIVNHSYNPITSDLKTLNWDIHSREWFDGAYSKAFTEERSALLGDGSANHIQIGTDKITFFGTAYQPLLDYIYYKDIEPGNKMYKFSIEPKSLDWHTLNSFGFMINCTTKDGLVSGYYLALKNGNMTINLIDNADIAALAAMGTSDGTGSTSGGGNTFNRYKQVATIAYPAGTSGTAKKDFIVESTYTGFVVKLGGQVVYTFDLDVVKANDPANVPADYVGGSDFGMYAAYTNHSCTSLSYAVMSEIGLYSESSAGSSSIAVKIMDYTKKSNTAKDPASYLTFTKEGFIGQSYTITPPQKIGKLAYIGEDDEINGIYGEQTNEVQLAYANPTVVLMAVDKNGAVIKQEVIDGLDLNRTYEYLPAVISGYKAYQPQLAKTVTLTKASHYQVLKFWYESLGEGVGVPRTGDSGEVLWALAACVSSLAIVFAFSVKKEKKTHK